LAVKLNRRLKKDITLHTELLELLPGLRRYAYSLCGSADDADDLCQSAVERILAKGVPEDVVLAKWAFRICRNLWIDQYRATRTRQQAVDNPILQDVNVSEDSHRTEHEIQLAQVSAAMQELGEEQRSALSLVTLQSMSYKDAAEVLEVPVGTVMSRISRARANLIKSLSSSQTLVPGH
jgi:RNA polymerase sigma-70 factor (ECF subfamily)